MLIQIPPRPEPDTRLRGQLRLSYQALAAVLQLPAGCEVTACYTDHNTHDSLCVHVLGMGVPMLPGQFLLTLTGTITTNKDGPPTVDWGVPLGSV